MMEDPGVPGVGDLSHDQEADASMAMAAAEAAAAAEEQEQQLAAANSSRPQEFLGEEDRPVCRICGKGPDDDGRPLCRFLPAADSSIMTGVCTTLSQDISLHVFCGKTASILPNVNQPDLEILSKAGIKNKHGIGPEVNGALARTRSSTIHAEGAKEKIFYIVKEFEGHLAAIRSASLASTVNVNSVDHHPHHHHAPHRGGPTTAQLLAPPFATHAASVVHPGAPLVDHTTGPVDPAFDPLYHTSPPPPPVAAQKIIPHKAHYDHGSKYPKQAAQARDPWVEVTITPDGKIRCGCGGTHLPTGTAKGDASWRSHVMTKRHQKWMEENGLLGAV